MKPFSCKKWKIIDKIFHYSTPGSFCLLLGYLFFFFLPNPCIDFSNAPVANCKGYDKAFISLSCIFSFLFLSFLAVGYKKHLRFYFWPNPFCLPASHTVPLNYRSVSAVNRAFSLFSPHPPLFLLFMPLTQFAVN